MNSRIFTVISSLFAPALSSPSSVEGTTVAGRESWIERERHAVHLLERGHNVRAAEEFEALWAEHPEAPRLLLNAAASRRDAGQFAHAAEHERTYLAIVQPDMAGRARVEAEFRETKQKLTPVHVSMLLSPASSTEVTIVAQRVQGEGEDTLPPLKFPVQVTSEGGQARLELDRGGWQLTARYAGHTSETRYVLVGQAPVAVTLRLWPIGAPPPAKVERARQARRARSEVLIPIGLGTVGGTVMLAGSAVVVAGWNHVNRLECPGPQELCRQFLRDGLRLRDGGAFLVGGGLGVLIGGLVGLAPSAFIRRKLWVRQVAFGGVFLAVNFALLLKASVPFNRANKGPIDSWDMHVFRFSSLPAHAVAANAVGLGLGLVASGTVGLLLQRRQLRRWPRLTAQIGPRAAQIMLSGAF